MAKHGTRGPNQIKGAQLAMLLRTPGLHTDGGGLYLRVGTDGRQRSWLAIFRLAGRRREIGLGSADAVSLARAREKAAEVRALVADGVDPIERRRAARAIPTFGSIADDWIAAQAKNVKSEKSVARWRRGLGEGGYADAIRARRVDSITADDVLTILRPLWQTKPTTARPLRGYIENVLDLARVRGHRTGENPARFRGHLEVELGKAPRRATGHAAMSWRDVPAFVSELRKRPAVAARALEFTILTAVRTSEALGARWGEFDLDAGVWTIPGDRMKMGKEHRVPLTAPALKMLRAIQPKDAPADRLVFGGTKPLSAMSMAMLLRRMGCAVTVHGFRSSFRDFAGDGTNHARDVAEMCLAHAVGDAVERAYRRGDALARRRSLMADWAAWIDGSFAPIDHESYKPEVADEPDSTLKEPESRSVRTPKSTKGNPGQTTLFE